MAVRRRQADWEAHVGAQIRELRTRAGLRQVDLAKMANVSVPALQRLEAGKGSSLATLIPVVRALGRESWLEQLAPPVPVSPMERLRESKLAADKGTHRVIASRRDPAPERGGPER